MQMLLPRLIPICQIQSQGRPFARGSSAGLGLPACSACTMSIYCTEKFHGIPPHLKILFTRGEAAVSRMVVKQLRHTARGPSND